MTVVHGNSGSVKVGSTAVAKVRSFSYTIEAPVSDSTAMGDEWETHLPGSPKSWSGSLTCRLVKGDAGQAALSAGASIDVELYSEGALSGDKYATGTVTVTRVGRTVDRGETVEVSFDFTGSGPLSESSIV